jgi:FAD-dependent urate hydroxylase
MHDVAVIGAGPYGLAASAFLRKIPGLELRVFGEPMQFWRTGMPPGMLLRSAWSASHIADPECALTLDAYKNFSGNHLSAPVRLERFVDYGLWHQRSAAPEVDTRAVCAVWKDQNVFRLRLQDGEECRARRLVVAAGISAFAHKPGEFGRLPAAVAAHTSEQTNLRQFAGKRVAVVGGGQSALESAALLHEAGCGVELLVRRNRIHWLGWKERLQAFRPASRLLFSPTDVGPAGISRLVSNPHALRKLPRQMQDGLRRISTRPAGARWLVERLRDVPISTGTRVTAAAVVTGRVRLELSTGETREVDYVLLGTGYRVDAGRYRFLGSEIVRELQTENGFPKLSRWFESSVSGLHFLGAPAGWSFGPMMYFVSGTRFAAETLQRHFREATTVR